MRIYLEFSMSFVGSLRHERLNQKFSVVENVNFHFTQNLTISTHSIFHVLLTHTHTLNVHIKNDDKVKFDFQLLPQQIFIMF